MDNAQKAIMLGVGLFITIIVIAAVMAITGIGQDLISSSQTQLSGMTGQLASQTKKEFDNQKMSGSLVRQYVDQYYTNDEIAVYVYTGKDPKSDLTAIISNGNTAGGADNTYRISSAKLTAKGTTMYTTKGSEVSKAISSISDNVSIGSASVSGATVDATGHDKTETLSYIKAKINAGSQFKSVVITNDDTGALAGILFVRYQ